MSANENVIHQYYADGISPHLDNQITMFLR
jgi:hypothetical protein